MTKKILCFVVILFSILLFYNSSFAQSPLIFGPKKYTKEKGRPEKTKETVQVCSPTGIYKFIVESGLYIETEDKDDKDEKDKDREKEEKKTKVSAAEVEVNGKEVIEEDDFNKKVTRVEKTILLPQGENLIEVEIEGKIGTFITLTIECQSGCLQPKITSPTTNSIINKSKTIIRGNLYNAFGETGVILKSSGVSSEVSDLAQTQAANFAGIIPLQTGANTITATASDACGYKATDTITINTETIEEPVRLTATPSSGILSATIGIFEATLEVETSIENPVSKYSWDLNGDGTIDQEGSELAKVTTNYRNTGLYSPSITITDTQGNTYTETAVVNVMSRNEMDALLKGKWEGMRGELISGDVSKALQYFAEGSKEKYQEIFNLLSDKLPTLAAEMQDIQLLYLKDTTAKYRVRRKQIINSQQATVTYYIYFTMDENGLWKIVQF